MPKTLEYVVSCYRVLLWLYPPDLRQAYGNDMADVFKQLLWAEWTSRGIRGVAVAGRRAIGEVFTIAIPRQLVSDWMIATGVSLVITSGVLASLVGVMMSRPCR
jgi:hypothetical protein